MIELLEATAIKLDACVSALSASPQIKKDTKVILVQQAAIYAAAISDFLKNPIAVSTEATKIVVHAVDQFCALITHELGQLATKQGIAYGHQ